MLLHGTKLMMLRVAADKFNDFIQKSNGQMEALISHAENNEFDDSSPLDRMAVQMVRGLATDGRADKLRSIGARSAVLHDRVHMREVSSAEMLTIAEELSRILDDYAETRQLFEADHQKITETVKNYTELN